MNYFLFPNLDFEILEALGDDVISPRSPMLYRIDISKY